ncbi:GmrSD restriction endonuclease domain-containing protein [Salirhabdus salicampi]|uniref:GmrSD restriction endonuclease domain-containing protein n=1 Tax=Salirhabdus salicampi TaxID=476102 RepID=UPI0020C34D5F|nr:DUF262 domain-containing protein [Salirhabdus salicampi]
MSKTLFKKVDYSLSKLIHDIDHGDIGLPELQRPFVWSGRDVRNLFDSMYKGFPVGYFLFWSNEHLANTKQIGTESKQAKVPRLLIVDGQQRLTSLYAVLKGKAVLTEDYKEKQLQIAFRPRDGQFEVADAAIKRDPEFIPDISVVWKDGTSTYKLIRDFLKNLSSSKEISNEEEETISDSIDQLYKLEDYPFTAMEISSTVDEEQVSDIFVRINSKGKKLNQADFILTLLSVFWDEGRKQLEDFCKKARIPASSDQEITPYNNFIMPDPDHLLRVSIGLGFKRARLKNVYSVLRGKDMETGKFSEERRDEQFDVLKKAQSYTTDLQNWHEFMKVLVKAGFRSRKMVSSETTLLYAYAMFLIGKVDFKVDPYTLRNLIARYYFMLVVTGRYTNSPETVMERDLARLRGLANQKEFIRTIEKLINDSLTNDFWQITLVNNLETSSAQSPALFAYYASLNLLEAKVLFSKMKVSELIDPILKGTRNPIERHHLFPKDYLKSIGITETRRINQVANFALVEWGDNNDISNQSPKEYYPEYLSRYSNEELRPMTEWHALPDGWESMDYNEFLEERRKLMASVIKKGFYSLCVN